MVACRMCDFCHLALSGRSGFITVGVISWVPPAVSHSDLYSCTVGSSAVALRSHVVLGCGVATCTSFTWWAWFLGVFSSCCSFSTITAVSICVVVLFHFSANELFQCCEFWVCWLVWLVTVRYLMVCGEWCSHVEGFWCIVYTGVWCGTIECVGLVCYCSVQVPGVVVSRVEWSLASSVSPKWSFETLWSGSRCPVSMLCGVSAIPMVHLIDFCQHFCFRGVVCSCFIPDVDSSTSTAALCVSSFPAKLSSMK